MCIFVMGKYCPVSHIPNMRDGMQMDLTFTFSKLLLCMFQNFIVLVILFVYVLKLHCMLHCMHHQIHYMVTN